MSLAAFINWFKPSHNIRIRMLTAEESEALKLPKFGSRIMCPACGGLVNTLGGPIFRRRYDIEIHTGEERMKVTCLCCGWVTYERLKSEN